MFWVGESCVFVTVGVESLVTEGHCLRSPPKVLTSNIWVKTDTFTTDSIPRSGVLYSKTAGDVAFFSRVGRLVKYDNSEWFGYVRLFIVSWVFLTHPNLLIDLNSGSSQTAARFIHEADAAGVIDELLGGVFKGMGRWQVANFKTIQLKQVANVNIVTWVE